MTKLWAFWTTVAMTAALGVGTAAAQPDTCFPPGYGVPFDSGPPRFRDFNAPSPAGGTVDRNYDDPRWRGAAALAYTTAAGTANPPVQFRTVWGDDASATAAGYPSTQFLYMQWLIRIGIDGQEDLSHDVFVGFERPNANALPDGHKRSFLLRLHIGATPNPIGGVEHITPGECGAAVNDACPTDTDYFEVYEATENETATFTCTTLSGGADKFDIRPPSPVTQEWWDRSFSFERRCASSTASTCTLWVVTARVPIIAANAAEVESASRGVELGSNFWYQVALPAFDHDGNPFTAFVPALVDNWPRAPGMLTSNPLCEGPSGAKSWFKDLDKDDGSGVDGPNPWSLIQIWDGNSATRPSTCFGGIALTPDQIGAMARDIDTGGASVPSDSSVLSSALGYSFKANISAGNRATNLVAAKPINRTSSAITTKLKARFRFAEWGAQPAGSNATWSDIRGSGTGTGVCASGGLPSPLCNDVTLQPFGAAGDQAVIKFDWTIGSIDGNDATFTLAEAEEYCQFGLTPPSGSGWVCFDNCNLPSQTCNVTTQLGCGVRTDPTAGPSGNPCRRKLWQHQCMLVELDSDSPADIETASTYRNMDIQAMSETQREATISTGGFAPIQGQPIEEIYLVVMPRNMPSSIPSTDGLTFLQDNAARVRDRMLRPYVEAAARLTPAELEQAAAAVAQLPEDAGGMDPEVIERVDEGFPGGDLPDDAADLMPRGQRRVASFLDGLSRYDGEGQFGGESYGASGVTHKAIDVLDDITATEAMSTLDIYAFSKIKKKSLVPMSSFTLVVHHEGPLYGITWQIDGTTKISDNLFRVNMPTGHRRKIRVRAMAKESANASQASGDRRWPCLPGAGHGNTMGNHGHCSEPE